MVNKKTSMMLIALLFLVSSAVTVLAEEVVVYSARDKNLLRIASDKVMNELDIDISNGYPKDVDLFVFQEFEYVITVCDNAKETCPVFKGKVKNTAHIGFEDPAEAIGTEEEIWMTFRRIRDEIYIKFDEYFKNVTE